MATISLTLPQSGTVVTAGLHSSNYGTLQSTINGGLDNNNFSTGKIFDTSKLMQNGALDKQTLLWANGSAQWAPGYPPGYEYGYAEFTANATVTATTQATASTVVTAPAVTFDGSTAVWVEFFSQSVEPDRAAAARTVSVTLYDGSTALTDFATVVTPTAAEMGVPVRVRRKLTPSAAAHTFSARAYVSAGSGVVTAGDGLSGHAAPGYISVYKA